MTVPQLSVLELALREDGRSVGEALQAVVRTAVAADELGFRRFWLSEHRRIPAMSTPAPAVVIARVASMTSTIRVGAGGVMLRNHSPLATAETYATLEAMFPGRIDLGMGRGTGSHDDADVATLRGGSGSASSYREDVRTVLEYLDTNRPGRSVLPDGTGRVPCWALASSPDGARLAAELGLPLAFAHHLRPGETATATAAYRDAFAPSSSSDRPWVALSVLVVSAASRDEAVARARPGAVMVAQAAMGPPDALAAPEALEGSDVDVLNALSGRACVGTGDEVGGALIELAESTGADELQLVVPVYAPETRVDILSDVRRALPVSRRGAPARPS